MPDKSSAQKMRKRYLRTFLPLFAVLILGILGLITWPLITMTASGIAALGYSRTLEIYALLMQVAEYNGPLNIQVEKAKADPFGPDIRRLESLRLRDGLSATQENVLGNYYLRRGEYESAIAAFNRSLSITGERYDTLLCLGLAYMRLGESQNCFGNMDRTCLLPVARVHTRKEGASRAAEMFARALARKDTPVARWLLNLTHMLVGTHPQGVPERYRIFLPQIPDPGLLPGFADIAGPAGVDKYGAGRGCALGDFDNDGRTDIIAAGMWGALSFYHNEGNGGFSDWTERSGLDGVWNNFIVVAADYDNDGFLDLYVTRLFLWGAYRNVLLHNEGGGRFRDVTDIAGVACPGATMSAAWGDYDNDGFVDLYVSNISDEAPLPFGLNPLSYIGRTRNALYRNNGDGTFTDVAAEAGVDLMGLYLGAVWGDYDADGNLDLYVSRFFGPNVLFRNQGDGTFVNVAAKLGVEDPFCSFVSWFWDYDSDGRLDILSTGWAPLSDSMKGLLAGFRDETVSMQLYHNRGDGTFENRTVAAGLDRPHGTMAGNFGDMDNDGFPDFALGTGSPQLEYVQPNAIYHNNRNGTFTEVGAALNMGHIQKGHGFAFADFDSDGRVDIYLPVGGAYPGDSAMNILYHNNGPGGHWLAIDLAGAKEHGSLRGTNRSALGARLSLTAGGSTRVSEVSGGCGFGSSSLRQHFGLGDITEVERLEVFWPASGARQVFQHLKADRLLRITEFTPDYEVLQEGALQPSAADLESSALSGQGHQHHH